MLAQALAKRIVVRLQQVLTNCSQKVIVTNEIRGIGEYLLHCPTDAFTHIMDRCQGIAIGVLDLSQERDDRFGFFRTHFLIFQHDFRDSVQSTHQMRAVPLTGGIQMQDVSSATAQQLSKPVLTLFVCHRQVHDELCSQNRDFSLRDTHPFVCKLQLDLLFIPTALEHGFARIHHHVVAVSTPIGSELPKFSRGIAPSTVRTAQNGLVCPECSDGQSGNGELAGFVHLEHRCAVGTVLHARGKPNRRCASEQPLQRNASGKPIHMLC
ncbi:hypothetical protein ES708_26755 [subsurface metagenome]